MPLYTYGKLDDCDVGAVVMGTSWSESDDIWKSNKIFGIYITRPVTGTG